MLIETANIGANHLNSKYLEEEVTVDGSSQKLPVRNIVTGPMSSKISRSNAVASRNDEGSFPNFL